MRVFVTGACGFIGSHLVETLISRGHQVIAGIFPGENTSNIDHLNVERTEIDLRWQYQRIEAVLLDKNIDVIFHLAARVADWGRWREFRDVTVFGTHKLITAAARASVKRFVLISSLAVLPFGNYRDADELVEPKKPMHNYGLAKLLAEQIVALVAARTKMEYVIVRPGFFPFGPRDRTSFVPLIETMRKSRVPLIDGGRGVINTAYVENLAYGISLCGEKDAAKNQLFVIADEGARSWRDILGKISEECGGKSCGPSFHKPFAAAFASLIEYFWRFIKPQSAPPITRYRALATGLSWHFKIDKAKKLLGYEPKFSFEEGLERTLEWYRSTACNE